MRGAPDETERKATSAIRGEEKAVTGSEAALIEQVLDRLPQGVVTFDTKGKVLFVNQRYCEIFGMPRDEVKAGLTMTDLFLLRSEGTPLEGKMKRAHDNLMEAMREGKVRSSDFVTRDGKSIHCIISSLPAGGWIVTHEDVTEQRKAERRIEHMARHDALTNLPNRASFQNRLEQALHGNRRGELLAVMFLDIDNFKAVNDTLGHPAGDKLLQVVAERLRHHTRAGDFIARFGGDEFVIACPALDSPAQAAMLAARVRETILQPMALSGNHVVVDASIGIALAPGDGTTAEQLLKNADLALFSAKGNGRGAYHFFEREMDIRMMERRKLELDLRAAFEEGQFEIHYQPLLNLEHNRVLCCEALLRWKHPLRGMVPPKVFIPVAEEIGLIGCLGEWVIRKACAEAAQWPEGVTVAVNVSPVQFRSQNLEQIIAGALVQSGLPPERLQIEITEAVLLDQTDVTLGILRRLHARGVRIAMDDFGTGYSSLSYLQKFPFDKIKIDRAFISDLGEDGESNAIVRAVTGIASSFRMETTAEGVETEAQRRIVTALGCTELQGHLFSAARPANEIALLLRGQAGERHAA